jgi:hypothetical protein
MLAHEMLLYVDIQELCFSRSVADLFLNHSQILYSVYMVNQVERAVEIKLAHLKRKTLACPIFHKANIDAMALNCVYFQAILTVMVRIYQIKRCALKDLEKSQL